MICCVRYDSRADYFRDCCRKKRKHLKWNTEGNTWNETWGMKFVRLGPACSYVLNLILTWRKLGVSTSHQMLGVRQEGRGQGTTIKRMMQPLRRTGYHKNQLEPTRSKMVEDLTSSKSWASSYVHCNTLLLFSLQVMSDSSRPHGLQHARHPCPSLSPGVCPSSCLLNQWYHPTISSFVTLNTFSSVQSLSCVWLFVTPWIITACQASLPITNSWNLLKLMFIKAVMPFSHLIFCHPLLLLPPIPPSTRVFSSESTLCMRWPKYWSFSFSISPSNEHPGLSPLGWTGWIFLQFKGLSRVFSNTTVQKHQFFSAQLSLQSNSHIHTWPLEKP